MYPYALPLPEPWSSQGWSVRIFAREGPEAPHATVRLKTKLWRINLRTMEPMDTHPPPQIGRAHV